MVDVQDSSSLRLYLDETQNVADAPDDIFEEDEEMPQVGFIIQQIGGWILNIVIWFHNTVGRFIIWLVGIIIQYVWVNNTVGRFYKIIEGRFYSKAVRFYDTGGSWQTNRAGFQFAR